MDADKIRAQGSVRSRRRAEEGGVIKRRTRFAAAHLLALASLSFAPPVIAAGSSGGLSVRGEGVTREEIYIFPDGEVGRVVTVDGRRAVEFVETDRRYAGLYLVFFGPNGELPSRESAIRANLARAAEIGAAARQQIDRRLLEACFDRARARHSALTQIARLTDYRLDEETLRMDPSRGVSFHARFGVKYWSGATQRYDLRCTYVQNGGHFVLATVAWEATNARVPWGPPREMTRGSAFLPLSRGAQAAEPER